MKKTTEKYFNALIDLRNIDKISNPQSFTKERKIGERFIKTCIELDLITKISSKNYKVNNFNPTITLANKIKSIMYNYNNSKRIKEQNNTKAKTSIQPQIEFITDEQMIQNLKSKGYKIFKPVTEFQEI